MQWRFLHTPPAAGDLNMAIDTVLCRGGYCEVPTLRIFGWRPFCLSLGYHQSPAEIDLAACRRAGIDVARRPTGGGAIFHAQEVTYSVAIPVGDAWYGLLPLDLYRRISEAIAAGLRLLGAAVSFAPAALAPWPAPRPATGRSSALAPVACFATSARNEILCAGRKLVGSAQRRFRGGALQHGSILLGPQHHRIVEFMAADQATRASVRSHLEGHTITLGEACGRAVKADEVITALREGFAASCDIHFGRGNVLVEENELAEVWRERFQVFTHNKEASLCADIR